MKLALKNVRLSFPNLFEPQQVNGEGKPAFSAAFILPPDHPQVATIRKCIEEVALEKWKEKGGAILKELVVKDKVCLHNGDGKAQYDGYAGNFFITSRNPVKPLVLDADKSPLSLASGKPYGGCFVNASVELWAQDNKFGKRVNATLRGVQFLRDGEAFAAGAPADESEFDDISDQGESDSVDAGAATAGAAASPW